MEILGNPPIVSGVMGRNISLFQLHPDTLDYHNRILLNGGEISGSDLQAVDSFVKGVYQDNLRQKILDCSPWAGNNLNSALVKLWHPAGVESVLVNTGFTTANYTRSTGITGANVAWLNTRFNPVSFPETLNNIHFGMYSRSNTGHNSYWGSNNNNNLRVAYHPRWSDGVIYWDSYSMNDGRLSVPAANSLGMHIATRTASTDSRVFVRGNQIGIQANNRTSFPPNLNLFLFAAAQTSTDPVPSSFDNRSYGGYSIGFGVTPTEASAYSNLWQTLMTAFERQV